MHFSVLFAKRNQKTVTLEVRVFSEQAGFIGEKKQYSSMIVKRQIERHLAIGQLVPLGRPLA
jgi:hypothetical protein